MSECAGRNQRPQRVEDHGDVDRLLGQRAGDGRQPAEGGKPHGDTGHSEACGNALQCDGARPLGDDDGVGSQVRLQHALGIAHNAGKLYVADTYNSKIKVIDPADKSCKTFVGGDRGGWFVGSTFSEPGGLSFAEDKLYVADTNNHKVRVIDLKTGDVKTLTLAGLTPP